MDWDELLHRAGAMRDDGRLERVVSAARSLEAALKCPICDDVLRVPSVLGCCRQAFCHICIRDWMNANRETIATCPCCRKEIREVLASPDLEKVVRTYSHSDARSRLRDAIMEIIAPSEVVVVGRNGGGGELPQALPSPTSARPLEDDEDGIDVNGELRETVPKIRIPCLVYNLFDDKKLRAELDRLKIHLPPLLSSTVSPSNRREAIRSEMIKLHADYTMLFNCEVEDPSKTSVNVSLVRREVHKRSQLRFMELKQKKMGEILKTISDSSGQQQHQRLQQQQQQQQQEKEKEAPNVRQTQRKSKRIVVEVEDSDEEFEEEPKPQKKRKRGTSTKDISATKKSGSR